MSLKEGYIMDNEEKRELNLIIAKLTEENKTLQVALKEQTSQKKEFLIALEEFVYKAAHDIKNPLFAITGFSTLLQESMGDRLAVGEKEYLELIKEGGADIALIIKDITSYATAVSQDVVNEEVNTDEVLQNIIIVNGEQAVGKGVLLRKQSSFPVIKADKIKLEICLQQLVSNAIKFHDTSKNEKYIDFSFQEEDDKYQFIISDNGIGIAESNKNIFAPFSYLNMQKDYKGTGMGLAICDVIIKKLGGKLSYESQIGEGSTFYITLIKG